MHDPYDNRSPAKASGPVVEVTEGAMLTIRGLTPSAAGDLELDLCIPNPKYDEAVRFGRYVGGMPRTLSYARRLTDGSIVVPRGSYPEVRDLLDRLRLPHVRRDATVLPPPVRFRSSITLTDPQEQAVRRMAAESLGVLVAPAGSGKTTMALELMARRGMPTLWLVHTRELAEQTCERAVACLGLDPAEIGTVGGGKRVIGEKLTIATMQTLARDIPQALFDRIGFVIVDECHHVPALQMAAVVSQLPARYLAGLSATPYRRDRLNSVIHWYLGPISAQIDQAYLPERLITPRVERRDTGIRVDGDSFSDILTCLAAHPDRTRMIARDVAAAVGVGRTPLVLSDRVDHVEQLASEIERHELRVAVLHGERPRAEREQVRRRVGTGEVAAVVATGALCGEGLDMPRLDALFLASPVSYRGRLVQYMGRVSRTAPGKRDAVVIDYTDDCPMLWSSWAKRRDIYREAGVHIQYPTA